MLHPSPFIQIITLGNNNEFESEEHFGSEREEKLKRTKIQETFKQQLPPLKRPAGNYGRPLDPKAVASKALQRLWLGFISLAASLLSCAN